MQISWHSQAKGTPPKKKPYNSMGSGPQGYVCLTNFPQKSDQTTTFGITNLKSLKISFLTVISSVSKALSNNNGKSMNLGSLECMDLLKFEGFGHPPK